jgi:hypothetical protein
MQTRASPEYTPDELQRRVVDPLAANRKPSLHTEYVHVSL